MVQTFFQANRPRTTTLVFLSLVIPFLCLSTFILQPASGLPASVHLARRGGLLSSILSLPPHHRRLDTSAQEFQAEAGVVIPPSISIREVEAEAKATEAEATNAKRALPRLPGKGRPGSGTYYPGQPYGRREVNDDLSS
ncbi:hypothetical protein BG015_011595 [Linnemannia schmuckeri]|uniref:Uncharacterized protein n=1 Tax=Linnemannia schmuckeri TaxID=64567 RepID=A0A9P5V826_9FUNG|nr:hypothetical protein BG015_011595 [Linnemannia schmuckeri]